MRADSGVGADPGAAASAVGDRNEARPQRLQPPNAAPELMFQRVGLRRERIRRTAVVEGAPRREPARPRTAGRSANAPALALRYHRPACQAGRSWLSLPHACANQAIIYRDRTASLQRCVPANRCLVPSRKPQPPPVPNGQQSRHVLPVRPGLGSETDIVLRPRNLMRAVIRRHLLVITAVLLGNLGGCATPPPASDPDAVADYKESQRSARADQPRNLRVQQRARYGHPAPGGAGLPFPGAGAGAEQHPQRAEQSRNAGGIG